jgi:hypothetical protein
VPSRDSAYYSAKSHLSSVSSGDSAFYSCKRHLSPVTSSGSGDSDYYDCVSRLSGSSSGSRSSGSGPRCIRGGGRRSYLRGRDSVGEHAPIKRWKKVCRGGHFYSLNRVFLNAIAPPILYKNTGKLHRSIKNGFSLKSHSSEFLYLAWLESYSWLKSFTTKWIINLRGAPHKKSIIHYPKIFNKE